MTSPSQTPAPVTVTSQGKSKRLPNFKGGITVGMGIVHIIAGLLVMAFDIVGNKNHSALSFMLLGVWIGIVFIITGCVGIGAGRTKMKRVIVTFLVMSVVCIMLAVGLIGYAAYSLSFNFEGYSKTYLEDDYVTAGNTPTSTISYGPVREKRVANDMENKTYYSTKQLTIIEGMCIATMVVAGVEFIIGIISAVFCCMGYCGKPLEQTQVVYVAQSQTGATYSATSPQGQQIIMLRQGGNGTPQLQRSFSPKEAEALSQSPPQTESDSTQLASTDPPPPYRDDMV